MREVARLIHLKVEEEARRILSMSEISPKISVVHNLDLPYSQGQS